MIRLQKYMALCGVSSRRAAEKMIEEGLSTGRHDVFEGYHELTVCRKGLRAFLPLLFR